MRRARLGRKIIGENDSVVCLFFKSQDDLIKSNANLSFLKLMPSGYVIFIIFY